MQHTLCGGLHMHVVRTYTNSTCYTYTRISVIIIIIQLWNTHILYYHTQTSLVFSRKCVTDHLANLVEGLWVDLDVVSALLGPPVEGGVRSRRHPQDWSHLLLDGIDPALHLTARL